LEERLGKVHRSFERFIWQVGESSSGPKSPGYGRGLPEAVIHVAGIEGRLLCSGMFEQLADGAPPGGFGNIIATSGGARKREVRVKRSREDGPAHLHGMPLDGTKRGPGLIGMRRSDLGKAP